MTNKTKILSELSKMAVDAMNSFSGLKKEVETIVRIRVEKAINKMNLVKRDEFENLKEIVQKLANKNKAKTNKKNLKMKKKVNTKRKNKLKK